MFGDSQFMQARIFLKSFKDAQMCLKQSELHHLKISTFEKNSSLLIEQFSKWRLSNEGMKEQQEYVDF